MKNLSLKTIPLLFLILFSSAAHAQVSKVYIQASGLTCSMCSNAINKALKTVPFVDNVTANIKTSAFEVAIKPNSKTDFDLLKKRVEDAGFFVAKFTATMQFNDQSAINDGHVTVNNQTFHFLNISNQKLSGERTVKFLDKGFVSSKEHKKNKSMSDKKCYKTGIAASCCTVESAAKPGARIFHVTFA